MFATLDPLALAFATLAILIGLVLMLFGRGGVLWLISGVGVLVLPRVFVVYAPSIACAAL